MDTNTLPDTIQGNTVVDRDSEKNATESQVENHSVEDHPTALATAGEDVVTAKTCFVVFVSQSSPHFHASLGSRSRPSHVLWPSRHWLWATAAHISPSSRSP